MVIDMQRAFVEGPGAIPRIGTVLPAAQRQIEAARAVGALVLFLQNDLAQVNPTSPRQLAGNSPSNLSPAMLSCASGTTTGSPEPTWMRCFVVITSRRSASAV